MTIAPLLRRTAALAVTLVCLSAGAAWALSANDIVKMRDAGMGDAVIVKAIQTQGVDFEATPEVLLSLKEKKLSDEVLVAVIEASARRKPAPAAPPATEPARTEPAGPTPPAIVPQPEPVQPALEPGPARKNPFAPRDKKCEQCASRGILPCPQHKVTDFVVSSAMKEPPQCCLGAGWVECPNCRDDLSRASVEELRRALAGRVAQWKDMDKAAGDTLFHGETRHLAMDTDLPPAEAAKLAGQCEGLLLKLREVFKADDFEFTRPACARIINLGKVDTLTRFVDWFAADAKLSQQQQLSLMRSMSMSFTGSRGVVISVRERCGSLWPNFVIHGYGHVLMSQVYGYKGRMPDWITEGFSSFCETVELGRPGVWCIDYDEKEVTPGMQWKEAVRRAVAAGKAVPLEALMGKSLNQMKALDYQEAWSVTTALIYGGGGKYLKFLEAVKGRTDQTEALEKAYGVKIEDIERTWKDYAARQ